MDGPGDDKNNESACEVTILMPCLNEAETLQGCIAEAREALESAGVSGEVLIADNGSDDGSQQLAESLGARVVDIETRGYGSALIGGIDNARGEYVLMGDSDGSYDFRELPRFLEKLRAGAELVMGCRLPRGGGTIEPGAMPWLHRWVGNPVLSALGRLFFRLDVDDFHCGLRAFRRDAAQRLALQCTGMEFASEMPVKASLAGYRIEQVPITLRPDRRSRPPHLRSWRDGWRHLRFLLLFSPKWLFYIPGLLLFTTGLIGFLALVRAPLTIGDVTFDTNTLLVTATMILVGIQFLFFAVVTKAFAARFGVLPPDARTERILSANTIEFGVVGGALLLVAGLAYLVGALFVWQDVQFGDLPYAESLRIVIPSVTAIALGVQSMAFGFVLAIINLPLMRDSG